jgi:hypothetical protein
MAFIGKILKNIVTIRGKYLTFTIKNINRSQYNSLRNLIERAAETSFGKTFGFTEMLMSHCLEKEFQEKVPIYDYDSIFRDWWHKVMKGKKNVCWPGKIKYFALSSGTSGASSKKIPISQDMLMSIRRAGIRHMATLSQLNIPSDFFVKDILLLGGSTYLNKIGPVYEGDLSGIMTGNLPQWINSFYKPGKEIAREKNWNQKLEQMTLSAKDWDIGVIAGVPAWIQILFEKIIQYYNVKNIHEIWPNLLIYAHGGVNFEPYRQTFQKLLGKDIYFMETYLASEGFLAFQRKYGKENMQLVLKNGIFYEFIPFNDENFTPEGQVKPEAIAITLDKVEENTDYALLISTNAGAWRYLIGDTLKFTSKENYEIILTGRISSFLSLCGEHLSVDNMNQAIRQVSDKLELGTKEFTVAGISYENLFAHHWFIGVEKSADEKLVRQELDYSLKRLNDDYATERTAALKEVIVEIFPNKVFYDFMEKIGKSGGQNKFPRVLKGDKLNQWKSFLKKLETND